MERWELLYLPPTLGDWCWDCRSRGIALDPDALMVEALRHRWWGGRGAEDLREIAIDLNKGKALRFDNRLAPHVLQEWAEAQ